MWNHMVSGLASDWWRKQRPSVVKPDHPSLIHRLYVASLFCSPSDRCKHSQYNLPKRVKRGTHTISLLVYFYVHINHAFKSEPTHSWIACFKLTQCVLHVEYEACLIQESRSLTQVKCIFNQRVQFSVESVRSLLISWSTFLQAHTTLQIG